MPKQVCVFLGLVGYYRKLIKNFAKMAKPVTLLTHQQAKFEWTPTHHNAILTLKESVIQAPILLYPDLKKHYIVYTDASDNACGAQLSQEHDGMEFPIAFLSHTFTETQWKWSTTEQEACGVYYTVTKWNYYLQGAKIIVRNDHKLLARFLNGKNVNNKVNRWGLELATYNITFKWISGACNKAVDCQSCLVELPQNKATTINMLSATHSDGPAFNTRSRTAQHHSSNDPTPQTDATAPVITETGNTRPKSLSADRLEALLQMQKTDPFCKHISKWLSNGKAPKHQGSTQTYCLMKRQYYWKGMNKDIWKYITQCALCHREKAKVQAYPLQMTEIPECPFNKIAIDLVTKCKTKFR